MRCLIFLFTVFLSIHVHAVIIGTDDRQPLTVEQAEARGLKPSVQLFIKKGREIITCTGAWISKTHVLTARHCVARAEKILVYNQYHMYLSIYKAHGKRFFVSEDSSNNQLDWYNSWGQADSRPHKDDWAVIEIVEEEIKPEPDYVLDTAGNFVLRPDGKKIVNMQKYGDGSTMGIYKLAPSTILDANPTVTVANYHFDADNALHTQTCSYRKRTAYASYRLMYRSGLMEIDCDMRPGASGSSILSCKGTDCSIVGIFSGEYLAPPTDDNEEGARIPEFSFQYSNAVTRSENFLQSVRNVLRGDLNHVKAFPLLKASCKLTACLSAL